MNRTQSRGRSRRRDSRAPQSRPAPHANPTPKGLLARLLALLGFGPKPQAKNSRHPAERHPSSATQGSRPAARKPELLEVTSPRLYVGNLSYEASESDLFELFNGVGQVQNAEVVTNRHTQRSKGFAFVQMASLEEAKRAVEVLHDKEFMGRKLLVSGAKRPGGLAG